MRAARFIAHAISMAVLAGLAVLALLLLTFGLAIAAEQPAAGMTCTYTKPGELLPGVARTYGVQVTGTFEASYDRDGRPWLWVKRPSEARYQSVIVPAETLSGCQR